LLCAFVHQKRQIPIDATTTLARPFPLNEAARGQLTDGLVRVQ
jgi:hypothetical protein